MEFGTSGKRLLYKSPIFKQMNPSGRSPCVIQLCRGIVLNQCRKQRNTKSIPKMKMDPEKKGRDRSL
jgi:hypothetical protein